MSTHACSTNTGMQWAAYGQIGLHIVPSSSHKCDVCPVRAGPSVKETSAHVWGPECQLCACPLIDRHLACWDTPIGECRLHIYEDGPGTQVQHLCRYCVHTPAPSTLSLQASRGIEGASRHWGEDCPSGHVPVSTEGHWPASSKQRLQPHTSLRGGPAQVSREL